MAVAIGFAFLIAPSGWIVRILSPEITGWSRPPDLATIRDPYGLSFMLGLVIKEVPFLVLMILSATSQIPARAMMATARSMGYAGPTAWLKVVFPQVYRQIRLPVFAVLAFTLSVVEVGLILAPGHPPPLSVAAARWFGSYDPALHRLAAAAALLQLLLVVVAIGLWVLVEQAVRRMGAPWIERGGRGSAAAPLRWLGRCTVAAGLVSIACILAMAVWSFAQDWRFPDALPRSWTFANWGRTGAAGEPVATTLAIGAGSSALAVLLTLACLENEDRRGIRPGLNALWLLYLPLLIPQIAFLFGVQVLFVRLGLDTTLTGVVWAHLLFVLPYVFLTLSDPFRKIDPRYARIAAGLGTSPLGTLIRVKVPILLRPVLISFAVGFAVSVGQYLPTLFAGGGRVATLTTEAVTLAGSADRRLIGVTAFLQAGLPLLAYALALAGPRLLYTDRRGLL